MGGLNVLAAILAIRIILLISVGGAIVLAVMVVGNAEPMKLAALVIYGATCVLPVAWLARPH